MGCANIARRSVIPAMLESDDFEIYAIASRDISKAKQYTELFGGRAVQGYNGLLDIDEIEALYVPLPTGMHEEWILKALEKGKHVFAEKSLASDLDSANRMIESARCRKLVLMENFMYRNHNQHRFAFEKLLSGALGSVRLFTARFGFPPLSPDNFRYSRELGGGALLDAAAYTVNVTRWFFGNDLEVIDSILYRNRESKVILYGNASLFSRTSGISSNIAFGFDNFYQCYYEIWGSKGILRMDRAFTAPPGFRPPVTLHLNEGKTELFLDSDNHFLNILKEFSSLILKHDYGRYYDDLYHQSRLLNDIELRAKMIDI